MRYTYRLTSQKSDARLDTEVIQKIREELEQLVKPYTLDDFTLVTDADSSVIEFATEAARFLVRGVHSRPYPGYKADAE